MTSLPFDVIWDILLRLAVKDLFRFRCVSIFFISLIDSPEFVKKHAIHSENSNTCHIYAICDYRRSSFLHIGILDLNRSDNHVKEAMLNQENRLPIVLRSSYGLLAMRSYLRNRLGHHPGITIWNPFNGKFKRLPPQRHGKIHADGFGYDSNTDDYKFLSITGSGGKALKPEVYSLKSNSWKEIVNGWSLVSEFFLPHGGLLGVVANNALHWMVYDSRCEKMKIVAFDMVKGEFQCVPLLECLSDIRFRTEISVLDGCLSWTHRNYDEITCVWVMKEYNVENSWTKLFSFLHSDVQPLGQNGSLVSALAFTRARDKVLLGGRDVLGWYDIASKKIVFIVRGYRLRTFATSLVAFQKINWDSQFEEITN